MDVRGRWPVGDSIYAKMPTESYGISTVPCLRARIKRETQRNNNKNGIWSDCVLSSSYAIIYWETFISESTQIVLAT